MFYKYDISAEDLNQALNQVEAMPTLAFKYYAKFMLEVLLSDSELPVKLYDLKGEVLRGAKDFNHYVNGACLDTVASIDLLNRSFCFDSGLVNYYIDNQEKEIDGKIKYIPIELAAENCQEAYEIIYILLKNILRNKAAKEQMK